MASDQIMHVQPEVLDIDETNNYLNGQLWKLCAGPLFHTPKVGDKVENNTNEIYAEVALLPDTSDVEIPIPKNENNIQNINYFTKVLSASDTCKTGGFVLYKRHAMKCLLLLDMSQLPPSQEIIAKDIHGHEWIFKHILRAFTRVPSSSPTSISTAAATPLTLRDSANPNPNPKRSSIPARGDGTFDRLMEEIEAASSSGDPHSQSLMGFVYGTGMMREKSKSKSFLRHNFAAEDAKAPHLSSTLPPTLPWKFNKHVQPNKGLTRQGNGNSEELRCVIAVIRHGDRTPKQKVKLNVTEEKLLNLMLNYNGGKPRAETKLKSAVQLQDLLDATKMLVPRTRPGRESDSDPEDLEHAEKLRQVKAVIEEVL
ncbi:hypothetical protein Bca52824_058914 [Brassica carinata]|uniref:diphosphoinositol-pentakisphosphate 1-kinase n=1 Tax=Brassica carinata TaxID=52824 RepID=A0A8X7UF62_BRACI|nr:hypothetical protein Bca52824_058914 [Brassica carinata]